MAKKNFYAVKRGNDGPAIYNSWPECEAKVKGFQGAVFKGFVTRPEAEAFLDGSAAIHSVAKKAKVSDGTAPAAAPSSAKPNAFTALMSAKVPGGGGGIKSGDISIFTDGACAGNQNVATSNNPAGWGACVVEGAASGPPPKHRPEGGVAIAELFGPVDLDPSSPHFLGAEVASNNTGELSAVCKAAGSTVSQARSRPRGHPTLQRSTRWLGAALWAREERPRRVDAKDRLRRSSGACLKTPTLQRLGLEPHPPEPEPGPEPESRALSTRRGAALAGRA